jgi:uncharacterized protein YndB with AHSA1/START domain
MQELLVHHRVYIAAPVSDIFNRLTSSEGWCGWFASSCRIDRSVGGKVRFEWVNFGADRYTATDEGSILEYHENRRFSFSWNPAAHPTNVCIEFEEKHPGCNISIKETGFLFNEQDVSVALQVASGWGEALTLLKFHVESGLVYGDVPES